LRPLALQRVVAVVPPCAGLAARRRPQADDPEQDRPTPPLAECRRGAATRGVAWGAPRTRISFAKCAKESSMVKDTV